MASFHCAVKSGGGGRGSSHSDYIEREGKYKTGDKDDLEHSETLNLPAWAANSAEFWKQSDALERANASGYREYEIGLPREMTPDQRLAFVREFIATEIGEKHVCTFAIHCPSAALEGGEQPHAHIMFSERTHDGIERATPEHYFKRANTKEPERGGCKKSNGVPKTPVERKADLVALRERFAKLQNKHLERLGHADRVTHLSLKAQGIERTPEQHLGPKRIQAKAPEVVQLMAARADRTLSNLLRRTIAAVERRLSRLFRVQEGRAEQQKAAVSALQAKATQSPPSRPAASLEPVAPPAAPRKDTPSIGASVSAADRQDLMRMVAALAAPGTPWEIEPARAGQTYAGAVVGYTDTHVFQRGEGFSVVAHDIAKLQNPAAINAQIDSGKIKPGVQLDVTYGQDRGDMQHRAAVPIAKPLQAAQLQPVLTSALAEVRLFDDAMGRYTRLRTEKIDRVAVKLEKRQQRRQEAAQAVLRRRPSEPTGMFAGLKQGAYRQALDALEPVYQRAQKLVKQAEGLAKRFDQVAHQAEGWAYAKLRETDPALTQRVEAHRTKERVDEYTRREENREARQALKPHSKGMSR